MKNRVIYYSQNPFELQTEPYSNEKYNIQNENYTLLHMQ